MNLYFDASALVPMYVPEISSPVIHAFADAVTEKIYISDLAAGELASAISRRVRMGELAAEIARERLALFDEWIDSDTISLPLDTADIRRAIVMVRRFDLKLLMPDAIHAALCARHELRLVTLDERLAEAARELEIEVIVPK